MPEEFKAAMKKSSDTGKPLYLSETEVMGVNHAVVGAMLVKRWNFSDDVVEAIRGHHEQTADNLLTECLYLADRIAKNVSDVKITKATDTPAQGKAKRLGLTVERATALLGDLDYFVKEAEIVLQASAV
jgi:HD-like signal output (HDOD) protein